MNVIINNEIKAVEVRVVSDDKRVEQMKLSDAIKLAEQTGEDVILLNDKSDIPVVKIDRYDKFMYERQKKEKEMRKKQKSKVQQLKEIHISDSIATHDMETKAKNIDRLLKDGDKVQIVIKYKGRLINQIGKGKERIQSLLDMVTEIYKVDVPCRIEGNKVSITIKPDTKK